MLMGCGVMTAASLMLFAASIRRIRYSTAGILQYISPSLVFLTAVFIFGEPMRCGEARLLRHHLGGARHLLGGGDPRRLAAGARRWSRSERYILLSSGWSGTSSGVVFRRYSKAGTTSSARFTTSMPNSSPSRMKRSARMWSNSVTSGSQ